MQNAADLRRLLRRIDRRGYKAYRELRGEWTIDDVELLVDHVQADPFAAPSRLRVRVAFDPADGPPGGIEPRIRRIAFEDHLARRVRDAIGNTRHGRGSGRSGVVAIDAGGQPVLERTAVRVAGDDGWIEACLEVGLPAAGRRVLADEAESLLLEAVPRSHAVHWTWQPIRAA